MASKFLPPETSEDLFICTLCSNELIKPKLLPCLHRCCTECLLQIERSSKTEFIQCPKCNYQCRIPKSGVDGFQNDLHLSSILHLRHLQISLEENSPPFCKSCFNGFKVSWYCCKCEIYLCKQCHAQHAQDDSSKDHGQHIIKLKSENLIPEKLSINDEPPKCEHHPDQKEALFCCYTCKHTIVCAVCTNTTHKGHYILHVTESGKMERKRLDSKLIELSEKESRMFEMIERVELVQEELEKNVSQKKEDLKVQYEKKVAKLEEIVKNQQEKMKQEISIMNKRKDDECNDIRIVTEKKVQELFDECKRLTDIKEKYYSERIKVIVEKYRLEKENLTTCFMEQLQENFDQLNRVVETHMKEKENKLKEILTFADHTKERYNNFRYTTLNLLKYEDDCLYSQYFPGITLASQHLVDDVMKDFPQLESLSDFDIEDLHNFSHYKTVTKDNAVEVVMEDVRAKRLSVDGVSRSSDGGIVITGCATKESSYLSVINKDGRTIRFESFERNIKFDTYPNRFCSFLSEFLVATVCVPDEVGIYDVRDGGYKCRKVSGDIPSWTLSRYMYCVTTDQINDLIIVGSNGREIYIFNDQLKYIRTIQLPDAIRHCRDIEVHGTHLLICDYHGKNAYAVALDESEGDVKYILPRPDSEAGVWEPLSVCTDANSFIYMIWVHTIPGKVKRFLSQYKQDGDELLAVIQIDGDARCVSTFEEEESETIVVVTLKSGRLFFINREYSKYQTVS